MSRNEYHHLYATTRWRKIRKNHLAHHPLCVYCMQQGKVTPATVVDHIEQHKGNPHKFYSGPFQSLCKTHHDSTKAKEEHRGYTIGNDEDGMPIDPGHPWNR